MLIPTSLEVAVGLKADKLVYLSSHRGIWKDVERTKVYPRLTVDEVHQLLDEGKVTEGVISRVERGFRAVHHTDSNVSQKMHSQIPLNLKIMLLYPHELELDE